jgi:hypothetical protein
MTVKKLQEHIKQLKNEVDINITNTNVPKVTT